MSAVELVAYAGAVVVLALLLLRPNAGICAMIAYYPLIEFPRSVVPGVNAETIFVALALVLTLMRSGLRMPPVRVSAPVIMFVAVMIVGWLVANTNVWIDIGLERYTEWGRLKVAKQRVFTALLFFVVYWWAYDPAMRRRLLEAISLGLLIVSAPTVVDGLLKLGTGVRADGFFINSNHPGILMASFLVVPIHLAFGAGLPRWRRGLHFASYAIGALALVLTLSRAAWLAAALSHVVWFAYTNRAILVAGVGAGVLAATIAWPLVPGLIRDRISHTFETSTRVYRVVGGANLEGSAGSRLALYRTGFDMWAARPFLGHGSETFRILSPRYGSRYGILNFRPPHSVPLKLAAENGLLGVVALGWLGVAYAALGLALRRRAGEGRDLGPLLLAVGSAVVVSNLFHTSFLILSVASAFFWVLLALSARLYFARE